MKLTSYTITWEKLKTDLNELVEIKKEVAKEALYEEDFAMVRSLINDIANINEKVVNHIIYRNDLLQYWVEWEPFAEKIFDQHPDVSDILLIETTEPGKLIEKHWLCNRLLNNPTN